MTCNELKSTKMFLHLFMSKAKMIARGFKKEKERESSTILHGMKMSLIVPVI